MTWSRTWSKTVAACPLIINSMCQAQKLSTTSTDESISHINSYALQSQLCESARLHTRYIHILLFNNINTA